MFSLPESSSLARVWLGQSGGGTGDIYHTFVMYEVVALVICNIFSPLDTTLNLCVSVVCHELHPYYLPFPRSQK